MPPGKKQNNSGQPKSQREACNTPASELTLNSVLPMLEGAKISPDPQRSLWNFSLAAN